MGMMLSYPFDDAMHKIVDTHASAFLRRETGWDNLVTYFHRINETWVISLVGKDEHGRKLLMDIDLMGEEGERPTLTPELADSVIRKLKRPIFKEEAKKSLAMSNRRNLQRFEDRWRRTEEAHRKIHRAIKKRRGQKKADEYAQAVGIATVEGKW